MVHSDSNEIYNSYIDKQPSRGVLRKRCSKNMQQSYRRTPILNYDFNKVAMQLYWNNTSVHHKSNY